MNEKRCDCKRIPHICPKPPVNAKPCPVPVFYGWMRSTETLGLVPGARIPSVADENFNGWNYDWVRGATPLQYFENEAALQAAQSSAFTEEVLDIPENLMPAEDIRVGEDYVFDGGTALQRFRGYFEGEVPGGYATWVHLDVPFERLSPETQEPNDYTIYHYSLRRFTGYLDIDLGCNKLESAFLSSAFPKDAEGNYEFPLNDSIFVFVNGILVYWASNDLIGGGNVAANRLFFNGIRGIQLIKEYQGEIAPPNARFKFSDGWFLMLGGEDKIADIAPYLRNGKNVIDVIMDDYYAGGGMSKINFTLNSGNGIFSPL